MGYNSFKDLQVWQRSKALAVLVYRALKECRDFGLRDQMQRAAVSVPSNIAEGCERSPKDFARFISISIGSSSELRTQAYIAQDLNVIDDATATQIIDETKQLNRMLRALAKTQLAKSNPKSQ